MSGTAHVYRDVARVPVDPDRARVFELGWQSWSPTTAYPVRATSHRPASAVAATMGYRPGRPAPPRGFQGEGLLAVDPGDGEPVRVFAAPEPRSAREPASAAAVSVPSIRASLDGRALAVRADGPVRQGARAGTLAAALVGWADRLAGAACLTPRAAPTGWCSWYQYFTSVTEDDIAENLAAIGELDLPVEVIQIDDGWQAEIGDWTQPRFGSLAGLARRIRDAGRRAGIWLAPFLAGDRSRVVRDHPLWLIGGGQPVDAGVNWGQRLYALDTTHPGVLDHLDGVFRGLVRAGFDYFKLDFLYAGALDGPRADGSDPLAAYRSGLRHIRGAIGAQPYLLGCGAPILPSLGLVDAMRVSPDIAVAYDAPDGDLSMPSQAAATLSTVGRAFMHGRFWVNDPDCLIVRPEVERRQDWAGVVERFGGLRVSSDRIRSLDLWGLERTRELLAGAPPSRPFPARDPALDRAIPGGP